MNDPEEVEASKTFILAEETVLSLGNQILSVLGAEDPIDDLETFTQDSLYL